MAYMDLDVTKFLGIFAVSLFICSAIYNWIRNWNYPPGPIGLPLIGYLPFLGKRPNISLRDLSKKYGDIFSFYMGPKLFICIQNFDAAKEILNHPMALARPPKIFDFLIGKGGIGGSNGEEWQEQRRFAFHTMRDLGLGKGLWETMIQDEANEFVAEMKKANGQPIFFLDTLSISQIKNSLALLFGRHLDLEADKEDIQIIRTCSVKMAEHTSSLDVTLMFPWITTVVKTFNLFGFEDFIKLLRRFEEIFEKEVERRLQSKEEITKDDFIGCYLREIDKRKDDKQTHFFTVENLKGNLFILFVAGQDSTNYSVSWLLLLMANFLEVQKKVCEEIDHVIGRDGVVWYSDKSKMPYTMATLLEMNRWTSISLIFPPRYAQETFTFEEHTIPQGSVIVYNNWAVSHDPRYFEDPWSFKPERFLTEDGTKVKKIKGYGSFSFGKRNCPGEGVAMMSMYLYFVSIMQKFNIRTADGKPPDLEYKYSSGAFPKPQKLRFIER